MQLVRNYWLKNRDQRKWEQVRLVKIAQILTRWQRVEHAKKSQAMRAKAKEWADTVTSGRKLTQADKDMLQATEESLRAVGCFSPPHLPNPLFPFSF